MAEEASKGTHGSGGIIRVGISGWRYKPWRGVFYPPGLAQRRELEFAAHHFPSIELNGTFYSLQRPESFGQWLDQTPADFQFSVKGPRFITHMRRLKDVEAPLANFFAQGVLRLGGKLGPILWQLPPNFAYEPKRDEADRLEAFFELLPRTLHEAAELARRHDRRLEGRNWLAVDKDRRVRYAIEIRHESFVNERFVALLRRYGVSLVKADTVEWPLLMDVTADFVYCRLHGSEVLYTSGYTDEALDTWAARVLAWSRGGEAEDGRMASEARGRQRGRRDVFVYFDNDAKVRAPIDAQGLMRRVRQARGGNATQD